MATALRFVGCTAIWCLIASACDGLFARTPRQLSPTSLLSNRTDPLSSPTVMRDYVDDDGAAVELSPLAVPPNLTLPSSLREMVQSMLRGSPTFRRQCVRLMNADNLTVIVEYAIVFDGSRAATKITHGRDGRVVARVQLAAALDREELLGHEFEHIIEQLDGVDLQSMARRPTTGVWVSRDSGCFETERATVIGRQVERELRAGLRARE